MDATQSSSSPDATPLATRQFSEKALMVSDDSLKLEDRVLSREPRFRPVSLVMPRVSLSGRFAFLAMELVVMILEHLDMKSLMNVRATNYALYDIVVRMTPYLALTECMPGTLQAMADIRALRYFSVRHLYNTLRQTACHFCGALGTLFYIPLGARCCPFCVQNDPRLNLMPFQAAASHFALTQADVESFPTVHTISGRYGLPYRQYTNTHWLIHTEHAIRAAIKKHGNGGKMALAAEVIHHQKALSYERRCHNWTLRHGEHGVAPRPSYPRPWDEVVRTHRASFNFLCTTKLAPYHHLPRREKMVYRFCNGCAYELSRFVNTPVIPRPANYDEVLEAHRRQAMRPYTSLDLNQHVEGCTGANKLIERRGLRL